ncbi:MAG: aminotransferase class V-fold PLP-dependent enzyme [Candidatus Gracilibacteria bacterium]
MSKKTIISEFFTTVSFPMFLRTLGLLTYKLPVIKYGKNNKKLEAKLALYIGNQFSEIYSLYNGRSAIFQALKIIGVKKNDEIIVSGYTCVSVSNAVIQSGAKIIYSDINKKNLGFDLNELQKNITSNTKVIIVQHTFGKPSNIRKIIKIAKDRNILVIEDCAHSLGSKINGRKLGSFGDFSIFSTGRDKVISGITGGFLLINNKNYFQASKKMMGKLKMPSLFLIIRNLQYNIVAYKAYKMYDFFKLGKIIIFISRKLNIITEILSAKEKECNFKDFYYKLPNSLAFLAYIELKQLKFVINHRRSIAEYYEEKLDNKYFNIIFKKGKNEKNNYFRYPILAKSEHEAKYIYEYMRLNNILLGISWTQTNIVPKGTNLKNAKYKVGSCPVAEDISKRILILPNHHFVSPNDAKKIVQLLNNFKKS